MIVNVVIAATTLLLLLLIIFSLKGFVFGTFLEWPCIGADSSLRFSFRSFFFISSFEADMSVRLPQNVINCNSLIGYKKMFGV